MVPGPFLIDFRGLLVTLGPQKWSFCVGEVLFLGKSRFSEQMRFWIDCSMIWDGFGDHFGSHFGFKFASKNQAINQSDFGSVLKGFWLPIWFHFGIMLAPKIN